MAIARTIDPHLISMHPLLSLVGSIVSIIIDDLAAGIASGYVDPLTWQLTITRESLRDQSRAAYLSTRQKNRDSCEYNTIKRHLDRHAAAACALASLNDGRAEQLLDLMGSLAGSARLCFHPDWIRRRATALAANPSAYMATQEMSQRRAIERQSVIHHAIH